MSYDSGDMSPGDNETVITYSYIKKSIQGDALGVLWVNLVFNCIIHLLVCIFGSILNP